MLDDLRRRDDDFEDEEDDINLNQNDDLFAPTSGDEEVSDRLFLGMTAVERMFLSIIFFLLVMVLGLAFLVATGRIVL
jgi:hypothetical protein